MFDSLTVDYKFVEDVNKLMKCLTILSNGHCFKSEPTIPTLSHKRQGKTQNLFKKSAISEKHFFVQNFPLWFLESKGGSVYEWLCAYMEYILVSR